MLPLQPAAYLYATIKVYLAGIRFYSFMSGHTSNISSMVQLFYTLRGIHRTQGNSRTRAHCQPITILRMQTLLYYIRSSQLIWHDQLMLALAATLAFFGLLRSSEYTAQACNRYDPTTTLLFSDISFSRNNCIALSPSSPRKLTLLKKDVLFVLVQLTTVCALSLRYVYS